MIQRTQEPDGLIVTRCTGVMTAAESLESVRELGRLSQGTHQLFEIVLNDPELQMAVSYEESLVIAREATRLFGALTSGAVAFVGQDDAVFGSCRQMEALCSGSPLRFTVFRTEPEAAPGSGG